MRFKLVPILVALALAGALGGCARHTGPSGQAGVLDGAPYRVEWSELPSAPTLLEALAVSDDAIATKRALLDDFLHRLAKAEIWAGALDPTFNDAAAP